MIAITRGVRTTTFDEHGTALSVVDDFGPLRGQTILGPEWADPADVAEAQARIAAVTEPRRKKAKRG